jgi:hypothetical protein
VTSFDRIRDDGPPSGSGPVRAGRRPSAVHLHLFRRLGPDPFSSATLYRCRCGQVRPGF